MSPPIRAARTGCSSAVRPAPWIPANVARGAVVALIALVGCASAPPVGTAPPAGALAPGAPMPGASMPGASDPGYDWHELMILPFGMLLKESPVPLHEVLLFHDAARGPAEGDLKDCYGIDAAPPRLVGRATEEYLLCFEHDRLARIDAAVPLAMDEAATVFARACAVWRKTAEPAPAGPCEGRDGAVTFSAHLTPLTDEPIAVLALTLTNAADRSAPRGPAP